MFRIHTLATGLLAIPLVLSCTKDDTGDSDTDPEGCVELADGSCVLETFHNPPELAPDGDGVYHLTLAPTEVTLDGKRHCVRAYNGSFPGPTIVTPANTGTPRQVRIDLKNDLDGHAYRDIGGDETCACKTSAGAACNPGMHDHCATPPADCSCENSEGDECHMVDFNVTNLHGHGAHVSPDYARGGGCVSDGHTAMCRECGTDVCDGDESDDTCFYADDVLTNVEPGMGIQVRWDLDEDGVHHEGLNWYHPHIHGTTAMQVVSGAAGAWIVRGPVDALPGLVDAKERVMVFGTPPIGDSGFQPLAEGETCTEETLTFDSFKTLGDFTAKQEDVINGVVAPRMLTAPGQVERWRIVEAAFLDEVYFGLFRGTDSNCTAWSVEPDDTIQLTQIGRDGITLPQAYAGDYLFMSPGYRIDAVFGGPDVLRDGDTYCLVAARFLQETDQGPVDLGDPPTPSLIMETLSNGELTGILNVTANAGEPTTTTLPNLASVAATAPSTTIQGIDAATRCATAASETDADDLDQVAVLQVGVWTLDEPDPCGCDNYNVNCTNFETTDRSTYPYDRDLILGSVDHWRVQASFDGHPFHIHTNPFVVCPSENPFDPLPFPHWRDTYLVNLGRKVDLITEYRVHEGAFVLHCHKLTHEDEGMMELLRVCDPGTDPTCGDHTWRECADGDLQCHQFLAATECVANAPNGPAGEACIVGLGGLGGICGPNACASEADCPGPPTCVNYVCTPP